MLFIDCEENYWLFHEVYLLRTKESISTYLSLWHKNRQLYTYKHKQAQTYRYIDTPPQYTHVHTTYSHIVAPVLMWLGKQHKEIFLFSIFCLFLFFSFLSFSFLSPFLSFFFLLFLFLFFLFFFVDNPMHTTIIKWAIQEVLGCISQCEGKHEPTLDLPLFCDYKIRSIRNLKIIR